MTHDGRTPYRYYVLVDWARPDPRDPYSVFRGPAKGGPPYELFRSKTGEWTEQVSLVDYFIGQDSGAVEVSAAEAQRIADEKRRQ